MIAAKTGQPQEMMQASIKDRHNCWNIFRRAVKDRKNYRK
jgi:hypothetical protein